MHPLPGPEELRAYRAGHHGRDDVDHLVEHRDGIDDAERVLHQRAEFYRRDCWADSRINVEAWPEDAPAGALVAVVFEEATVNSKVQVIMVPKGGRALPTGKAEAARMPLGMVKNDLARLRKTKLSEDTGQSHPQTRAEEVRTGRRGATRPQHRR